MEPIRILHILTALDRGGIETMLVNYHQNIDREKIQFDYLIHRKGEFAYSEVIRKLGGRIYSVPEYNPLNPRYANELNSFYKMHKEYKIVHSHLNCLSSMPLKYAKLNGVPIRIAHAHIIINDRSLKSMYKLLAKKTIPLYATNYCACSTEAGKWMFPKKNVVVIPNAIDLSKFRYDETKRYVFRNNNNVGDKFAFGTVGRFTKQKNHLFLIELMKEMPNNVMLFIVGKGPLKDDYLKTIKDNNLINRVFLLNPTDDIPSFLCGIDAFLFPSIYEGLGIVAVEAQAAGLRTICSEYVPKEVSYTNNTTFLPLQRNVWIKEMNMLKSAFDNRLENRDQNSDSHVYDIKNASIELENFYTELFANN